MMRNAEQIIEAMSTKGLRITEQRRTIAQLFANAPGFLTPKDIYCELEAKYPGLSYGTVYRNLRIMHELGVVEQFHFEEGIKFKIRCMSYSHHHHLICLDCNQIFPLEFCPMDYLKISDTFHIERHYFEVYGYCSRCKTQGSKRHVKARTA